MDKALEQRKPKTILCENLIMCEGRDEELFLIAYLNSEERKREDPGFASSVQVWNFGGNEQLTNGLKLVQMIEGFSALKTILILRDAEKDAEKAEMQIRDALVKSGLPVPAGLGEWSDDGLPFTAYMLFPKLGKNPSEGTLEHLCMKLIKEEYQPNEVLSDVSGLMSKLKESGIRSFKHDFKSKLHGFISVTDPFPGLKIGEVATAGLFDWNSDELSGLNNILKEAFDRDNRLFGNSRSSDI